MYVEGEIERSNVRGADISCHATNGCDQAPSLKPEAEVLALRTHAHAHSGQARHVPSEPEVVGEQIKHTPKEPLHNTV